jgi:hypothetical protein
MATSSDVNRQACGFPGCERPVAPAGESGGRPPRYCDRADHNAQSAFRARRRRPEDPAATGPSDGGDRPVSLAAMTLRGVAQRFAEDLQRGLQALQVLSDVEQLEAELASVRADTHAEVSRAEQRAAIEQRARIEACEAAEDALAATEEARARADASQAQADAALEQARSSSHDAEQARRERDDAVAALQAASAKAAAAERRAEQSAASAVAANARAEDADAQREQAAEQAATALRERDDAQRACQQAERDRDEAVAEAARAADRADAAERAGAADAERARAADLRAERASERADAADERARDQRAALDVELAQLRVDHEQRSSALTDRAQAAEIAHERADAALSAERQLRTQLQTQLSSTEQRLAGAEKARDAAIAAVEQAAKRPPRASR